MLSNPGLEKCGLFKLVPVERLIVDEASQIRIFEFLVSFASSIPFLAVILTQVLQRQHLFEIFQDILEKVIFFGDPHQRKRS